jgi:hypothetical protein
MHVEEMRLQHNLIFSFLILFPLVYSVNLSFVESNIYYNAPIFDLKFANVTFGSSRLNVDRNIATGDVFSLGEALSSICQAELINQKKTQFSINGIINLAFQEFSSRQTSGQSAILDLLSNNLIGGSFEGSLPDSFNLTGLFGTSNFGTSKINSLVSNFYEIPFVTASDLSRSNPDNQFSSDFPAENRTFFQILDTSNYNTFSAVLQILNYFNWSLVGTVFQTNNFGFNRKFQVMDYAANNSIPSFACSTLFYFDIEALVDSDDAIRLTYYCSCIKDKNKIEVNILWMSTAAAVSFISNLREICAEAKDWTFIIADDFQSTVEFTEESYTLKDSLLIRTNGPWNYKAFLQECLSNSSPSALRTVKELLDEFLLATYNCKLKSNDGLKRCQSLFSNIDTCICDINIFDNDPYIVSSTINNICFYFL